MAVRFQGGKAVNQAERMTPKGVDAGGYAKNLQKGERIVALQSADGGVFRGMNGTVLDPGNIYIWVLWSNGQKLPIRFNLVQRA